MRGLLLLAVLPAVLLAALGNVGCAIAADGDFDGMPFAPTTSGLAVADRHDIFEVDGALLALRRSEEARTLHVLLSAAYLSPDVEMRREPAQRVLEWRRALASVDGLLLENLPLIAIASGDPLVAVDEGAGASGDFDFSLVQAMPAGAYDVEGGRALGRKLTVSVRGTALDEQARGGSVELQVEVRRDRNAGQPASDVAVGEVVLHVSLPLSPERLGKSNLGLMAPVLRCAHATGPARAGSCRDVPADPYLDETGVAP